MTETEIRFALTPPLARRLRNHYFNPENAAPKNPGTEHNETVYFDTPDHLLHRHGAEFRVRQNGSGFKQTVKYRLEGATLFSRAEAEINLPTADPNSAICATESPPPWRCNSAMPPSRRFSAPA